MNQELILAEGEFTPGNTWNPIFKDYSEEWVNGTTSQHGEDGILGAIFKDCPPTNRVCVEIGATEGEDLNVMRFINQGWRALLIEGMDRWYPKLEVKFKGNSKIDTLFQMVKKNDMDEIMDKYDIPQDFDLFILDIDSFDYDVWKKMKRRPHVMMVECHPQVLDLSVKSYNPDAWPMGATSAGLWLELFTERDYELVCMKKFNMIFIQKDFMKGLLVETP
jgi:hypothetical protein